MRRAFERYMHGTVSITFNISMACDETSKRRARKRHLYGTSYYTRDVFSLSRMLKHLMCGCALHCRYKMRYILFYMRDIHPATMKMKRIEVTEKEEEAAAEEQKPSNDNK